MEGDAKGQGGDDCQRQQRSASGGRRGQTLRLRSRPHEQRHDAVGVVAEVDDLVGVPLVAEDEDREEGDRQPASRPSGRRPGGSRIDAALAPAATRTPAPARKSLKAPPRRGAAGASAGLVPGEVPGAGGSPPAGPGSVPGSSSLTRSL